MAIPRFSLQAFVKAGDPVRVSEWNIMGMLVRALRVIVGKGLRYRETPDGVVISLNPDFTIWDHSFRCELIGSTCKITYGEISTVPMKIDDVPLDGGKDKAPPVFEIPDFHFDEDGRGYIAAEVTCDEKWGILEVYPVQVAYLESEDGISAPTEDQSILGGVMGLTKRRARHPLLMIRQRKDGTISTKQITMHSLQHRVETDSPNKQIGRHFFYV